MIIQYMLDKIERLKSEHDKSREVARELLQFLNEGKEFDRRVYDYYIERHPWLEDE